MTHYRVLKRCHPHDGAPLPYTLVDVKLETGRTHQIRVHFAHLRHPVIGDAVYGNHPAAFWAERGVTHQLLHAYAMRFAHPTTGQLLAFTAEPPADLQPWLAGCRLQSR